MKLICGCLVNDGIRAITSPCDEHSPGRIEDAVERASDMLRDEFAKAALTGLVRSSAEGTVDDYVPARVASDAYAFADAMLRARR